MLKVFNHHLFVQEKATNKCTNSQEVSLNSSLGLLSDEVLDGSNSQDNESVDEIRTSFNVSPGKYMNNENDEAADEKSFMEELKQESFQFGGLKHDSFRNSISFKSVNEGTSPFPWDDVIADNQVCNNNISKVVPGIWNKTYDPSFCSGKFSARSTSFGGEYNTRDENFSDFGTIPSFQVSILNYFRSCYSPIIFL